MQERRHSSALAMEVRLSCINLSILVLIHWIFLCVFLSNQTPCVEENDLAEFPALQIVTRSFKGSFNITVKVVQGLTLLLKLYLSI